LALACGGAAWADTFDLGATGTPPVAGWDATATFSASGGNWTLDFLFTNNTANTVDINSWALQLFNAGAGESFTLANEVITLFGATTLQTWNFFTDTKLNNGSTPDCNSTSTGGWLCAQPNAIQEIASGGSLDFSLSGTYTGTTPISALDLMSSGCLVAGTCSLDGGSDNGNKWAISGTGGGTVSTPEPGSLTFLGAGLLGLTLLAGRKVLTA